MCERYSPRLSFQAKAKARRLPIQRNRKRSEQQLTRAIQRAEVFSLSVAKCARSNFEWPYPVRHDATPSCAHQSILKISTDIPKRTKYVE